MRVDAKHRASPRYYWCFLIGILYTSFVRIKYDQVTENSHFHQFSNDGNTNDLRMDETKTATNTTLTTEEFMEKLLTSYNASKAVALPLWNCTDAFEENVTKLAFVHVFKTAGSSVSDFLRDYALKCSAGYARIISCTNVDPDSVRSKDGFWKHCRVKEGFSRNHKGIKPDFYKKFNDQLLGNHIDIIGGHFRLGTMDYLKNAERKSSKVRYMSFFRDAAMRYISGVTYVEGNKGWKKEQIVQEVKDRILSASKNKKYNIRYADYLKTLWQTEKSRQHHRHLGNSKSSEDTAKIARLVMQNLVDYNVIIGITENYSDSLEILQHLMDPTGNVTEVFTEHGMRDQEGNFHTWSSNPSLVSSSAVMKEIKNDRETYGALMEHVKFEQMIYNFALALHKKQYEAVKKNLQSTLP
mmetsp:Transcript_17119/g.38541  ORF Transcript_17119/g.38541 Transcript_17119/m.38541 type:complete len:411 (+) Transcript_17119:214-1446(+)